MDRKPPGRPLRDLVIADLTILALLAYAATFIYVWTHRESDSFADIVIGSAIYAAALASPFLLLGAVPFLTLIWRRGRLRSRPEQRRLAWLLAPLVGLPLTMIVLAAVEPQIIAWYAAATVLYALLARVPADFEPA
jgi:hypothetical protein